MKKYILIATIIFGSIHISAQQKWDYPPTTKIPVYDTIWGTVIKDDYRWMEDLKSPKTINWLTEQNDYTNSVLQKIPNQDILIQELRMLDNVVKTTSGISHIAGNRYFYFKSDNKGGLKHYYRDGEDGAEVLFFDQGNFSKDKRVRHRVSFNKNGSTAMILSNVAGKEMGEAYFLDVQSKRFLKDTLTNVVNAYFREGTQDEVIYLQAHNQNVQDKSSKKNMPIKLHKVGVPLSSDIIVFSADRYPELNYGEMGEPFLIFSEDSPYMILGADPAAKFKKYYFAKSEDLKKSKIQWQKLTDIDDKVTVAVLNGNNVYLSTTKNNLNLDVISTSLPKPDLKNPKLIVSGNPEWRIRDVIYSNNDYLIMNKSRNEIEIQPLLYEFRTARLQHLETGLKGLNFSFFPGDSKKLYIANLSWTEPDNIFTYDFKTKKLGKPFLYKQSVFEGIESLVSEEVEVPSWDGVMVPLTIIYDKKLLKKDGSNIVYMRGYGGFGINYTPNFNETHLPLLKRGVIIAYAHIRGGGEKGEQWHQAGMKANKPNSWKDFHACAEYLIRNKYTSAEKIGINGSSGVGLFMGRAIQDRPDLYKVAIMDVAVLNILRFENTPTGARITSEIGTLKNKEDFPAIYEMDAYQHIKSGVNYPSLLLTTRINDPRVPSYMPGSFAAKMQEHNPHGNPILLKVDFESGHFGASDPEVLYKENAAKMAFLLWQTGHPDFQPK